jgi:hypothetical protein
MKAQKSIAVCVLALSPNTLPAAVLDKESVEAAKHFLTSYLTYANTGNIELLRLYSDTATIKVTVTTLDGTTKTSDFVGQQWKQVLRESWYKGKPAVEPLELRNVAVKGEAENLEVSAQRYTLDRCYWDNNYNMTIAKDGAGQFHIIKETLYIDHKNQCLPPDKMTIRQNIKINQNPLP